MASRQPDRPNVLLVTSDDQGPWAMGCAGNPEILTPTLDGLASSGVRFARFFCASPVCSPARASIFTGLTPSQHGVHDWIRKGNGGTDGISYLSGLPALSEDFAQAGYRCGLSGKWHLGNSGVPQASFHHWFAHAGSHSSYTGAPMYRGNKFFEEPGYITNVLTDDAIRFISQSTQDSQPFYLNVNYTAPHHPWLGEHPKRFLALYDDCEFSSCPQEPPHPWLHTRVAPAITKAMEDPRPSLKAYFAAVTAMDEALGRLIEAIENHELRRATVILFLSDNGFACGHHGIWGKGNGTYPQNMYEESVQVPAIISQPGTLPEGEVVEDLVSAYDVRPTLLDMAGLPLTGDFPTPGHTWRDLLRERGQATERVVVFDEYGPTRMIRSQRWKFVSRYPAGPDELYDLEVDPTERENRVNEPSRQATIHSLSTELNDWFRRYSRPETDGWRLPVTGRGQVALVQGAARASDAFE